MIDYFAVHWYMIVLFYTSWTITDFAVTGLQVPNGHVKAPAHRRRFRPSVELGIWSIPLLNGHGKSKRVKSESQVHTLIILAKISSQKS